MRNRINGKQLSRTSAHRRAMLRNLASGLFEHGQIETTHAQGQGGSAVHREDHHAWPSVGTFHARRQIESTLNGSKDPCVGLLIRTCVIPPRRMRTSIFPCEEDIKFTRYGDVKKAPRLVQHVLTKVAPRYSDRDGGYTRIVSTGRNRLGDGADLVILQLVGEEGGPEIGGGTVQVAVDRLTTFASVAYAKEAGWRSWW